MENSVSNENHFISSLDTDEFCEMYTESNNV